jgi:hypothetical protein
MPVTRVTQGAVTENTEVTERKSLPDYYPFLIEKEVFIPEIPFEFSR